jgi:peptide/nickel transport system substrate-binding protein
MRRTSLHRLLINSVPAAVVACALVAGPSVAAGAMDYRETPSLTEAVARGDLPAISERVPTNPLVVAFDGSRRVLGHPGGTIRTLINRSKDVRLMVVYGYARLVGYDRDFRLKPDILERYTVEDGRIFTFHLRPGHKWSDGSPFTAEDFRYFWEDVASNPELSPSGPPKDMLVNGAPPVFEVIDDLTVRYTWPVPNPFFLPQIAAASPLFVYRPAHYLKKFHSRYAGEDAAAALAVAAGQRTWAALHNREDNLYKFDNPDLPTLQPWMITTAPPANRFVAKRNPFFHRVDPQGHQLPYIDEVVLIESDGKLISAKTGAGEVDLQARNLFFNDYTFLKEGSKRNDYEVYLWRTAKGAHLALFPNLNHNDPAWRGIFRDRRFRHALSLAIDRALINEAMYFGLALESLNTVLPESPLFRPEYAGVEFDLGKANALLDEMGLTDRDDEGVRLLPDGRPMDIIVETAGEDTEQTDVLELIRDDWLKIGIRLFTKPSQREVFRNRIFSGETQMSIWSGLENGLPSPDTSPEELAPTSQLQLQWPKWGQYRDTKGNAGQPPDMPAAEELMRLNESWLVARSDEEREKIWHDMLAIHTRELFTIGIVSGVLQPVVANAKLVNVPREGVYNWDPGAHFGVYRPETFWYRD